MLHCTCRPRLNRWETKEKARCGGMNAAGFRGADGSRNRDLFDANEALYQLSYGPLDVTLLCKATSREFNTKMRLTQFRKRACCESHRAWRHARCRTWYQAPAIRSVLTTWPRNAPPSSCRTWPWAGRRSPESTTAQNISSGGHDGSSNRRGNGTRIGMGTGLERLCVAGAVIPVARPSRC